MKRHVVLFLVLLFILPTLSSRAQVTKSSALQVKTVATPGAFPLVQASRAATIYTDAQDRAVVQFAASALSEDIERVTGIKPESKNSNLKAISGSPVIIGTIGQSKLIDQLLEKNLFSADEVKGKWESYIIAVVDNPVTGVGRALVIAGSDPRGTAFGVFELSRQMGVSPWYWWADAAPQHQDQLFVPAGFFVQGPPTVKYRGIFLNDEDWGLQPWAAQNIDKDIKDIGPKTYAHIFELLLRLKANLIWPAMHPSTKAFFHYPGNHKVADAYSILVGTSHAEPMMRNNVDEWKRSSMGSFDYFKNKDRVLKYWDQRLQETNTLEGIYTLGMRGEHDSGMEGAKNTAEAAAMMERILQDQRELLKKHINKDVTQVPQVFTAYKEVLDIYDHGLKLPEDITLVWPDDNYGYIHRLSNPQEQMRAGGSGVYYHASYWGRPHDYLWLSSTHPALIWEEMMKAYHMQSRQVWVVNVGDIKPLEYNMDLFLGIAYDAASFQNSESVKKHLQGWAADVFGTDKAPAIAQVLWNYYDLAFERKPEFMGWSQTEPTTKTMYTQYNHFFYGDEAQQRIDRYQTLENQVKALRKQINVKDADAFYQLVYYPVIGASLMNKKFLYRDKSFLYGKQNRISSGDYAQLARQAYDSIVFETNYFNNQLATGKWKGMMSMEPRNLPVYKAPVFPELKPEPSGTWNVLPEGYVTNDSSFVQSSSLSLPTFNSTGNQKYFVDLFLTGNHSVTWKIKASEKWINISERQGTLATVVGQKQKRIWISIDWDKIPEKATCNGVVTIKGEGKTFTIQVPVSNPLEADLINYQGFIETNGYISIFSHHFSRKTDNAQASWSLIDGLGHTGKTLMALPLHKEPITDSTLIIKTAPSVEYDFYNFSEAVPVVTVTTLPTHSVTKQTQLRYGVRMDDGPLQIVDFRTFGRSEEWKRNVLSNKSKRQLKFTGIKKGKHTLRVYLIDPGVILDQIIIDLGGLKPAYSTIPETINNLLK